MATRTSAFASAAARRWSKGMEGGWLLIPWSPPPGIPLMRRHDGALIGIGDPLLLIAQGFGRLSEDQQLLSKQADMLCQLNLHSEVRLRRLSLNRPASPILKLGGHQREQPAD